MMAVLSARQAEPWSQTTPSSFVHLHACRMLPLTICLITVQCWLAGGWHGSGLLTISASFVAGQLLAAAWLIYDMLLIILTGGRVKLPTSALATCPTSDPGHRHCWPGQALGTLPSSVCLRRTFDRLAHG